MTKIIMHTASLYYWWDDYVNHLDDRIHAILDAGMDGVEISNGAAIVNWQPAKETIQRLKSGLVTVHAELGAGFGVYLDDLQRLIKRLPFEVANVIIHPDELSPDELAQIKSLPFQVSVENMDALRDRWKTWRSLASIEGAGFTFDTAHAEENDLNWYDFDRLKPYETHLSIPNDDYYQPWGYETRHALTQFRPDDFPIVPSASPVVTLEGLTPPDMDMLKDEVGFVRERLRIK